MNLEDNQIQTKGKGKGKGKSSYRKTKSSKVIQNDEFMIVYTM